MANETEFDQDGNEQSNQTGTDAGEQSQTDSQKTYEVNGQKLTADQLAESYKNLETDYTKKTQELSKYKKDVGTTDKGVAEAEVAKQSLKDLGFVHQDDLNAREKARQQELNLDRLIAANPSLGTYKEAIKAIGKSDNSAYEDIVVKYGFAAKDKLAQAKAGEVMGDIIPKYKAGDKSINEMSNDEYETWRKQNLRVQ